MSTLLALAVGALFAAGVYLMLRRSIVNLVIGTALLSHGVNLLLFVAGGLTRARPPLVPLEASEPQGAFANPLPQALILTAIVITLGLQAFLLTLIHRTRQAAGTADLALMTMSEERQERSRTAEEE